jgi:AraC-like DNA-binding protein
MNWNLLYQFILAMGCLQGLIMSSLLWLSPSPRKTNNRFLALILLFFSYRLGVTLLFQVGVASIHNALYHLLIEYNWIYGPLLYFYIISYLDRNFTFRIHHLIHFIPLLIEFLFSNFIKFQNFYWDGTKSSLSAAGYWGYVLWEHTPFQIILTLGLILFYSRKSEQRIRTHPRLRKREAGWLRTILRVYVYFSLLALLLAIVDYLFFNYAFAPFSAVPTYIGMAVITYWLGMEGFARRKKPLPGLPEPTGPRPALSDSLHEVMIGEKLYEQPALSQSELAGRLGIPPYQLSQYLNEVRQQNFNDYINQYRVEAFTRALRDPDLQHLSLLGIAMEVGFNSKATFNRAVKKITGKTPGQLRKELRANDPPQ